MTPRSKITGQEYAQQQMDAGNPLYPSPGVVGRQIQGLPQPSMPAAPTALTLPPVSSGGATTATAGVGGETIPAQPPAAAMAGLRGADGGDQGGAGLMESAPGSINPNLGRRIFPNELSALRALTY